VVAEDAVSVLQLTDGQEGMMRGRRLVGYPCFVIFLLTVASLTGGSYAEAQTSSQPLTATISADFTDTQTKNTGVLSGTLTVDSVSGDLLKGNLILDLPWLGASCDESVGVNDATRTLFIIDTGTCVYEDGLPGFGVRIYIQTSKPLTSPGSVLLTGASYDGNFGFGGNLTSGGNNSVTVSSPIKPSITSCGGGAIAASSGAFSLNGWTGRYAVSGQSGLELDTVALAGRLMAQRMNLPYFKLKTSEFDSSTNNPGGHCALLQNGSLTPSQCRSRLVDLQPGTDGQAVQATYIVDQIPQTSNSCVIITQRYEFGAVGGDCPEDALFRCASFYPLVTYQFIPDPRATPTLQQIDTAQRFQFDVEQSTVNSAYTVPGQNTVAVTQDAPVPPLVNVLEKDPLSLEQVFQAIKGGQAGAWDNFHQTNDVYGVSEPGLDLSPFHPSIGAGCTECVHIHWRWGAGVNYSLNAVNLVKGCKLGDPGLPLVPGHLGCLPARLSSATSVSASNQDVTVAVVSSTQSANPSGDFTTFSLGLLDFQPVMWYGATGHLNTDTFFAHGGFFAPLPKPSLFAAVLPTVRSAQVGKPVTAFATIINASATPGIGCSISPADMVPVTLAYQTTNPATNAVTGTPNTPVNIAAGASQSFVFAATPTNSFAPAEISLSFSCTGPDPAPSQSGLNTLLLSASTTPSADIIALGATTTNDQILHIPGGTGSGAFAVATINLGAAASITASADTGGSLIPLTLNICQTNPTSGQCISPIGPLVTTQINANATPTFAVFATASGPISLDAIGGRIFVSFFDQSGAVRGGTSVAVQTQ
jgi:hypothetical protein